MAFEWLTNAFTGAPAQEAAELQRQYLGGVQQQGRTDIANAFNTGTQAVNTGATGAQGYLSQGLTGAMGQLGLGQGAYQPLADLGAKYGGATNLALSSLGVNGPQGNQDAVNAFQASPGYQWNVDQATNQALRGYNAGGMGASGNALTELQNRSSNLANQEYGNWQNRLLGFMNPELSATAGASSGRAGLYARGADTQSQYGQNAAGIETGRGQMLADLANRRMSAETGLATGLANPYADTYGQEAQAQMGGSANLLNAGLGLAGLGAGLYGRLYGPAPTR